MTTLGIDLAADPRDTGGRAIEWTRDAATVRWVSTGLDDEEILHRARATDAVGIDASLGWPTYFVGAMLTDGVSPPSPYASSPGHFAPLFCGAATIRAAASARVSAMCIRVWNRSCRGSTSATTITERSSPFQRMNESATS